MPPEYPYVKLFLSDGIDVGGDANGQHVRSVGVTERCAVIAAATGASVHCGGGGWPDAGALLL
jgi:hypothetical protein